MEKARRDSPRSTLGWEEDWGYESGDVESRKFKPEEVGLSHTRSKSLVGISSSVTPHEPKTPSLRLETLVSPSPTICTSFVGLSSIGTPDDGPKTPSPQLERRLFRSLSPPPNVCGSLLIPKPPSGSTDGFVTPAFEQAYTIRPPTPIVGAFHPPAGCPSNRDDEKLVSSASEDTWSVDSPGSSAAPATRGQKAPSSNRMQFVSSLNEELLSIKSCMKRAIDLGKKVQHYGALEVSQLRGEKADAEAAIQKTVHVNRVLEQEVITLRDELQMVQWERELEVLSMNNEMHELEIERNNLMQAAREEKKRREKLQGEVDSVLSVLLEEKMKLETERESHDIALRNEKKKLQAMRKARDAAVKALEEGNKKLEVERDAMLLAMRDLSSRLDFERDAKLRSMRRSSMDMATMMSGLKSSGSSRRPSFGFNDDAHPRSRPLSRQNSRQIQ